jgi:ubiquinone/menaquinone biosynthesis C-methylase UbiE
MFKFLFQKFADNNNPNSYSFRLRKKRFNLFINTLKVTKNDSILDVGGSEATWLGTGYEKNVTLLNISFSDKRISDFNYIIGDACNMHQIADKQFDIVFSNSVIEHVGLKDKQRAFAREVERVTKKYWVQTPNKHFPIEPHFLFPFFQYFPQKLQLWIGLRWKFSHLKRNGENIPDELSRLKLLTQSELSELFPKAKQFSESFLGLTKSLIILKDSSN